MSKYRILEKEGYFYPQYKWGFWWFNFTSHCIDGYSYIVRYKTFEDAKVSLDERVKERAERKKPAVIHEYTVE